MTNGFDNANFTFLHRPHVFPQTTVNSNKNSAHGNRQMAFSHGNSRNNQVGMMANTNYSPDTTSIRASMQQSPSGCSPTERRVNYLVKAKAVRMEKRASQSRFHQS